MITHPEKILFPGEGITKGELASYYEAIAPVMLPHLRRRPITMERFHRGIGAPGFFQKDVSKGFPEWLERVEVPKHGGTVHHPIANDTRSLLWLANQNSITIHVWPSRTPNLYNPTFASSISIPRKKMISTRCVRQRCLARSARRARSAELDQNLRLEGFSHCCSARW
jgi:DNA primase